MAAFLGLMKRDQHLVAANEDVHADPQVDVVVCVIEQLILPHN